MGGGMDAKSGVFTTPYAGSYLFIVHACTHDMSKALMTIRRNGNQVASFYDQNHESNHKNSMVGQSVILELEVRPFCPHDRGQRKFRLCLNFRY